MQCKVCDIFKGKENHRLCFVSVDNVAYFTPLPLEEQWGDDWNDIPYECNAGKPYTSIYSSEYGDFEEIDIVTVRFDGDFIYPGYCHYNSPYSVEVINMKVVPWLRNDYTDPKIEIYAGASIVDFIALIQKGGGKVYVDLEYILEMEKET